MVKTAQVSIRLEPDVLERADRVAEALAKATAPGLEPSRAAVIRAAVLRGLAEMEAELAGKPKPRAKR